MVNASVALQPLKKPLYPKVLLGLFGLMIIGGVIGGVIITGGPGYQRLKRFDEQRIQRLSSLQREVEDYHRREKRLPDNLAQMEEKRTGPHRSRMSEQQDFSDPVTRKPLEYRKIDGLRYELCAVFDTASRDDDREDGYAYWAVRDWKHAKGNDCFAFDVPPPSKADRNGAS